MGSEILPSHGSPACPDLVGVTRSMTRSARRLFVRRLAFADTSVAALALLKFKQRLKQPRPVEVRPKRLRDEYLRIGDLPQQKIAYPHLPARADQQIGVRQAFGVQVPRELLLGDLARDPMAVTFGKNRVHGINDL